MSKIVPANEAMVRDLRSLNLRDRSEHNLMDSRLEDLLRDSKPAA